MNIVDLIPWGAFAAILAGTVIPAVAAYVTHSKLPAYVIGLITPVLAVVAAFFGQVADNGGIAGFDFKAALATAVASLLLAAVAYATTWAGRLTGYLHQHQGVGATPRA